MVQETTFASGQTGSEQTCTDSWALAKKRANAYLKLHQIDDATREQLLASISRKLARLPACSEQELIRHFINTAQAEMASLALDSPAEAEWFPETDDNRPDSRIQTGPRFERSSIRVAPLQTINLGLLRLRHH